MWGNSINFSPLKLWHKLCKSVFQVLTHHCPRMSQELQPLFCKGDGVQEISDCSNHASFNISFAVARFL